MSDKRPAKSWLKRAFKRDSTKVTETNNLSAKPAGHASFHSSKLTASTPATSSTKHSTTHPSTPIPSSSRKTSEAGTNDLGTCTAGMNKKETAASPNLTQKHAADMKDNESTPTSLWDKAYDSLKQENPELLSGYEDLMSRVLIKAEANSLSAANPEGDATDVRNQIPQVDVTARRETLKQIAELGLKHMEDKKVKVTILGHEIGLQDGVGQVGEAIGWVQNYIKDAIRDVPYAPAVMAGISLILPLLKNPAAIDAANREGFTYIMSQMRYYIEMESLLLPKDMKPSLKADLTERVIALYTLIIDFQVQSVIRFYRSRTKSYFKSVINYDSWNDQLDHIKEEETRLEKKFEKVLSGTGVQQLKKLAEEAEGSRKALSDILDNMQELVRISQSQKDILERTERRLSNDEDRRCRDTLQATDPTLDKARIEEDNGGLLRDSYCWVLDHVDFQKWRDARCGQLLWIKGDPGRGKTMLLCGIIDELSKMALHDMNISFFFCQATNSRINNATAVLRGLIYMLVQQQPSLMTHIRDGSFEGENAWFALIKVFTKILGDPHLRSTYLVIDALDECTAGLSQLLQLLVQKSSAYPHVKWIVSSRNWPSIEKDLNSATHTQLHLELNGDTLSAAVDSYIQYKIMVLAEKHNYSTEIQDAVHHDLTSKANGTFLWVALVCKELTNVPKRHVRKQLEDFPSGLDTLYERMWNQVSKSRDAQVCKSLLGVITTVYRPITLDELASCIDLPEDVADDEEALAEIVGLCGSFLTLRGRTISLVHQSAKDFLHREAVHQIFPSGERMHYSIFSKLLQVIARTLKRDIYGLHAPGYPIDKVKAPDPDPLAAARYACVYWVDHLAKCSSSKNANDHLNDKGPVGHFLRQDYFHWLEALSLSRSLSEGVASMLKLESLLKTTTKNSQLLNRVRDACRFVLYHKTAIEHQPLQVYASGLAFSPTHSLTRIQFETQEPAWIIRKPTMEESWSSCLQTLEGHSDWIYSVTFSHDSKLLASASADHTVKIWDVGNGQCLQTLESHSDLVLSVAFSDDSKILASASADNTVKLWDVSSGQSLQTLEGHIDSVLSVAFSDDSKILASASADNTVKLWDASSGQCLQTLKGHSDWIYSVTFSHDSKLLASASRDHTVKIWDTSSGQSLQTLRGHSDLVLSVAFSHDSKILASASADNTVKLWDASSGQCLQTLKGHNEKVLSITFSYDSKLLASASRDHTVKIWDTSSGQCLQTLEGHSDWLHSVTFSHDSKILASASADRTVKVWDASSGQCLQTLKGHIDSVLSITFSHDSKLLASASQDRTVKIWDTSSGQCVQNFNVERVTTVKSFDITNTYLETDIGTVCLSLSLDSERGPTNTEPEWLRFEGYSISSNDTCITWNSENLLWLPQEYRPSASAVSRSTVCLGCSSGRVLLFTFNSARLLPVLAGH